MRKILQVVSCLELGGTEAFVMNNYRKINRNEVQFDFLVFRKKENYPHAKEIEELGGKIFFACIPQVKNIIKFIYYITKTIRENGPYDAVHSHVNIANSWVMLAAKIAGVSNRISHSHAVVGKEDKKIYRAFQTVLLNRCMTKGLACSLEAGNYLYKEKYFAKNGLIFHNGIDVDKILRGNKNHLKSELGLHEDNIVVGNITRIDSLKNTLFTIDVFYELSKIIPEAVLILGGPDGGLLEEAKKRVCELGIEKVVYFIGPRVDIPDCLASIDIYLFPSTHEGLGIALLEAQAAGCCCFASTGVPNEADMDMGTVCYLDLDIGAKLWAKKITQIYNNFEKPAKEKIKASFDIKGYDIRENSRELLKIYGISYKE